MEGLLETHAHLGPKDSAIYMALLRMGEMHIAAIVKVAGLKRSTVYVHIDNLARKGLIEKVVRGKRLYYRAANPKKLLSTAERDTKHLESALPDLIALFDERGKEPVVRVYAGKDGLADVEAIDTAKNC